MKKIITLKSESFRTILHGVLYPFIVIALLFTSCTKEDPIAPAQSLSGQSDGAGSISKTNNFPPPVPVIPEGTFMFISHGTCLGNCPVYTVTVMNDGWVIYEGKGNVGAGGTFKYRISQDELNSLGSTLVRSGFFEFATFYPYVPDLPQNVTSLNLGYAYQTIVDYGIDVPAALTSARNAVEVKLGINHLVNGDYIERAWTTTDKNQ